jgi:hypothetical protein
MITPYNTDQTQVLKWMHNNAPNITKLIKSKANWYAINQTQFWSDFYTNIFNLKTANIFGISIWCIILGVPSKLFGLYPITNAWAYGINRENFATTGITVFALNEWNDVVNSNPVIPTPPAYNIGGNFYGGGNTTIIDLSEVVKVLQLRYATLVSNGTTQYINRMLNYIFNNGEPWDYDSGNYFYLADNTIVPSATVDPITQDYYMEYRVGPGLKLSDQFITLLNSTQYGIIPTFAGTRYLVVKES